MGWLSAVVAGASLITGRKSDKEATSAQNNQTQVMREQLEFAREQYQNWVDNIMPLELEAAELGIDVMTLARDRGVADQEFFTNYYEPYREEAAGVAMRELERQEQRSIDSDVYRREDRTLAQDLYQGLIDETKNLAPEYERVTRDAATDVDATYQRQQAIDERNAQRMGLRPDSGRYKGMDQQRTLRQSADRSFAVNRAREAEKDRVENLKFSRLAPIAATYLNSSKGGLVPPNANLSSPGTPSGGFNQPSLTAGTAISGVNQAAAGMSGVYGEQAARASADAGAASYVFGRNMYDLFNTPSGSGGFNASGYNSDRNSYQQGSPGANRLIDYGYKHGGLVDGQEGVDKVPAVVDSKTPVRLTAGEYVIPKDVVDKIGTKPFDDILEKYHEKPTPVRQGLQRRSMAQ